MQGLALAQEFRAKDDVGGVKARPELIGKAHRDGGFDDEGGVRINLQHLTNDRLYRVRIEIIALGVVVGGRGDDHIISVLVGAAAIGAGLQIKWLMRQVVTDVLFLDGRDFLVEQLDLVWVDIYGGYPVMLG